MTIIGDAVVRRVTTRAMGSFDGVLPEDRDRMDRAVRWIARSGYARARDGAFDEAWLAEAAVNRYRSVLEDD